MKKENQFKKQEKIVQHQNNTQRAILVLTFCVHDLDGVSSSRNYKHGGAVKVVAHLLCLERGRRDEQLQIRTKTSNILFHR